MHENTDRWRVSQNEKTDNPLPPLPEGGRDGGRARERERESIGHVGYTHPFQLKRVGEKTKEREREKDEDRQTVFVFVLVLAVVFVSVFRQRQSRREAKQKGQRDLNPARG